MRAAYGHNGCRKTSESMVTVRLEREDVDARVMVRGYEETTEPHEDIGFNGGCGISVGRRQRQEVCRFWDSGGDVKRQRKCEYQDWRRETIVTCMPTPKEKERQRERESGEARGGGLLYLWRVLVVSEGNMVP